MNKSPSAANRLLELAKITTTPPLLRSAAAATPDIDSSQYQVHSDFLWWARWEGKSVLLLTLNEPSTPRTVRTAPVTIEPGLEDKDSVVLAAEASGLGLPLTVWIGLAQDVPIRALERPLGRVTADFSWNDLRQRITSPSTGFRAGTNRSESSPSAEKRAELEDLLEDWAEGLKPLPSVERTQKSPQKTPFTLRQVVDALAIPQRQAMDIVRGSHNLTPSEAERLAAFIGSTPAAIMATAEPLPTELLMEIEQPRWRHLVISEMKPDESDEVLPQLRIARQAFALAARQSGQGQDVWHQRLRTIALGYQSISPDAKEKL